MQPSVAHRGGGGEHAPIRFPSPHLQWTHVFACVMVSEPLGWWDHWIQGSAFSHSWPEPWADGRVILVLLLSLFWLPQWPGWGDITALIICPVLDGLCPTRFMNTLLTCVLPEGPLVIPLKPALSSHLMLSVMSNMGQSTLSFLFCLSFSFSLKQGLTTKPMMIQSCYPHVSDHTCLIAEFPINFVLIYTKHYVLSVTVALRCTAQGLKLH